MLSDTLQRGLRSYSIGDKVRELRLRRRWDWSSRQAYGVVGGAPFQIERGRLFPTLPTLLRVALVFSVSLEYFFETTPAATLSP